MATKVAVRALYIELIIGGFLACVLVARNLCLSENGTPISCPGSRHGNATGKGAGDGASSGGKAKVLSEGEVLNMGAKRNVKTGKKFRPLFLVSKGRSRPSPPKASSGGSDTDDKSKKPRLLKVEKDIPGNKVVEPQWPDARLEEKSEVMQSRGQLPEEQQGVFEFLDMFEVSDWLSNRRRQKGEDARRSEGSKKREVDSKEQVLVASKEAEQGDEEAEDSSKGERRAALKGEQDSSEDEVLRSVISKAKPVRITATIVAKTFLPRARLLRGSRSKAVVGNTEYEVTSVPGSATLRGKPLTDQKSRTFGNSHSLAALDVPDPGLNGTNASSRVSTELNPNGKDPSSSKTRRPTSNLEKEESSALGFSDDDSGIFGDILNAIFRDEEEEDDSIETQEELAFDEVDVLEAAKRDTEELMNRLDVVSIGDHEDVAMSRDESTVVKQLAELNEQLAAVNAGESSHFEDENKADVEENHVGDDEDSSTLYPEVGKKIQNSSEDTLLKSEGNNDSSKRKDFQLKATDVLVTAKDIAENTEDVPVARKMIPVKGEIIPVKGKIIPVKGEIIPVKGEIIPVKGKIIPVDGKIIPVKGEYITPMLTKDDRTHAKTTDLKGSDIRPTVQATDTPSTTGKNILKIADDGLPVDIKEILAKALDIRSVVEDRSTHVNHANTLSSTDQVSTVEQRGVAETVTDKPATREGIASRHDDLPKKVDDRTAKAEVIATKHEDLSKKVKEIPAAEDGSILSKQKDLHVSKKASDMAEKAEGIVSKQEDLYKKAKKMPATEESTTVKQEILSKKSEDIRAEAEVKAAKQGDLSMKTDDMPAKAKGISSKQDDLSKKAKEMPGKAKAVPTNQNYLHVFEKANDMAEKPEGMATKQGDLSKKAKELPATAESILAKQENLSRNANDLPEKAEKKATKQDDLPKKVDDIRAKSDGKATKPGDLPKKVDDIRSKSEGKSTKQGDLSENTDDVSSEPEDTTEQDEPGSKQPQDDESTKPVKASVIDNDTSDEDEKSSSLDKEEVKMAMFTEMGNIMSDLDYLGTLWEQLKPGMKLKNSDAVRKVLHAVSNVFGLEKEKDVVVSKGPSGGSLDRGKTAAERLRYDLKVQQRSRDNGQAQKGFKDVSSRDGPSHGQKKRVGLRSRRSLQGTNRRRVVQEAVDRRDRRSRRGRHGDSEGRKLHKRRSEGRRAREGGDEEEEDEAEQDIVVEEDWSNRNLDEGRLAKRTGNEDYIFGNNPGYILSHRSRRRRRGAPSDGAVAPAVAPAEDKAKNRVEDNAEDRAEDRAEEDAISRELANLLIEKVYNRVMKSLKMPKLENEEAAQNNSSVKPSEMQSDDHDDDDVELEERRKRNLGSDGSDLRRSKRNVDNVDMTSYCSMLERERYNVTDENGQVTDLYRQAINSGMCRDFHMAIFALAAAEEAAEEAAEREVKVEREAEREVQVEREAEREVQVEREAVQRRDSKTSAENAVGKEQGKLDKEVGKRVAVVESDGGMDERAVEGAGREVEMVVGREAQGEGKEVAEEEESSKENSNEVEEVNEREVEPDVRGARQREAEEEVNKREMSDWMDGLAERKVGMELGGKARQEQTGNEVVRKADEEAENEEEESEEEEEEAGNEVMLDTEEGEEDEEKDEMAVREAGDETMEELNGSAADVWDFASKEADHHLRGRAIDVNKRSVGENVSRRSKKKKERLEKSRRWSNAEGELDEKSEKKTDKHEEETEKTQAETDKSVDEFITFLDPMGGDAGQGQGQGQGQGH